MTNIAYAANFHERTAPSDYKLAQQGDRRAARRQTTLKSRLALRRLQRG